MADAATDDAPLATRRHAEGSDRPGDPLAIAAAGDLAVVTINVPVEDLAAFCADPANWSQFMKDVTTIEPIGDDTLLWVAHHGDDEVEWQTELVSYRPDAMAVGWTSIDGQAVDSRGHIEFHDADARGAIVTAAIVHRDAGLVGKLKQALFLSDPLVQARRDLRRLKQLFETGEIATAARNRALLQDAEG